MSDFIKNLVNGDLEAAREEIHQKLYSATGEYMNELKKEVAASLYSDQVEESEDETIEEELKGNQGNLDMKPPYGKLTAADFAALRAKNKKK
jgi:hypothetical protein